MQQFIVLLSLRAQPASYEHKRFTNQQLHENVSC